MEERGSAPVESWRPQRREAGWGLAVARASLIAGGAVVVLGLGYGGYGLLTRAPRAVPVIEADGRPLRVRPDSPGGMQVAGAEEAIMGGEGSGAAASMAPPPEVPQPQALRALVQAARQPVPTPAALAAPVPMVPAVPVERPAVPKLAVPPAATTIATAGGTEVQLAAMDTQAAAMAEWGRLVKRLPLVMAARQPAVVRVERDGRVFYRLRTGGFTDVATATGFCAQVKAKGGGCSVATF